MSKVAVIGLAGESVFLTVEKFHEGGETLVADAFVTQPGGKGFNQAVAAKRAGAEVSFLAAAGNDAYAESIQSFLTKEEIRWKLPRKADRTAYAAILTDRSGANRVTEYIGAQLEERDVSDFEEEIACADILLLSNEVPLRVNEAAARTAKRHGTKIILNPAPSVKLSEELKRAVWLFTPNEFETEGLKRYKNAVVTLGKRGCLLRATGETIPARRVTAVDTTGAGDVFNGYLAARLVAGDSLKEAAEIANTASGIAVTRKGAVTSVPYLEEVIREYGSLSERA